MKTSKRALTSLVAAAALMMGAGGALAHGPHGHGGHGAGPGPWHIERLADRLDLTPEQRGEIEAAIKESRPRMKELGRELREKRQALREQVRAGYQEDVVRQQAAEIGDLVEELTVLATRTHAEVYAVLTPEQRAELESMREKRREKFRRKRGEG